MVISWFSDIEERNIDYCIRFSPDVVIKLILSPEESIRRKPEEDFDLVRRKHDIIKSLDFPNSKVYVIDATMEFDEEIIKIKNIIWSEIREKASK